MSEVAHWAVAGLFAALLSVAALTDIFSRRIPNWAVIGLIVTCVGAWISGVGVTPWPSGLAAAFLALALSYGLYHFDWIGAGDAKLLAAAALFFGLGHLLQLAVLTALAGGVIALGFLVLRPRRVMRGMTARGRAEMAGRGGIPYGVAIAIGAVATALTIEGFFPNVAV